MKTKHVDFDDIGFIGDGRSLTEEESKLASAHIHAYMVKHGLRNAKPTAARKATKRAPVKRRTKIRARVA